MLILLVCLAGERTSPVPQMVKNLPTILETRVGSLGQEEPLEKGMEWEWQPTSVFLPGKSHGQRSMADYSPWGHKNFGHD